MIEFEIAGDPVPKGRPRFRLNFARGLVDLLVNAVRSGRIGGLLSLLRDNIIVMTYTPPETEAAEQAFAWQSKKHAPRKPLDGALSVVTVFVVAPPRRIPMDRSRDWPHVKPDDDNYRKLVLDALNGIFWHDDGQICGGQSYKIYGVPRTYVRITQLGSDEAEYVRRTILGEPASDALKLF